MRTRRLRAPSPSLVISLIALFVALGGTTYAATSLPRNSVGTKQLKKNAVTAPKIKNGAVVATKIDPAGLIVPNATHATSADGATNASHATTADHATTAGTASPGGNAGGALSGTYPNPSLAPAEAWHEIGAVGQPAFFNGWANANPVQLTTAGFYKDPWGVVHLKGELSHSGGSSSLPFFGLPVGYRPSAGKLVVENGVVIVGDSGALYLNAAADFVDLDGMSFQAGES